VVEIIEVRVEHSLHPRYWGDEVNPISIVLNEVLRDTLSIQPGENGSGNFWRRFEEGLQFVTLHVLSVQGMVGGRYVNNALFEKIGLFFLTDSNSESDELGSWGRAALDPSFWNSTKMFEDFNARRRCSLDSKQCD